MNDQITVESVSATAFVRAAREKVRDLDGLHGQVVADGRPCVLTKGVFDLLHAGHLRLFAFCAERARRIGGVVVVAVTDDETVRRHKGPDRPIQSQTRRLDQVAAVSGVDFVLLADQREPLKIINRLRPAVYVKGADTTADAVPDATGAMAVSVTEDRNQDLASVVGGGGAVVVFTDAGDLSTTDLVRTILAKGLPSK